MNGKNFISLIIMLCSVAIRLQAQNTSEIVYEAGESIYNAGTLNPFNNCQEFEYFKVIPAEKKFMASVKRKQNVFALIDATLVYTLGTKAYTIPIVKKAFRLGVNGIWKVEAQYDIPPNARDIKITLKERVYFINEKGIQSSNPCYKEIAIENPHKTQIIKIPPLMKDTVRVKINRPIKTISHQL